MLKLLIEGADKNTLNKNRITSTKLSNIRQYNVLLMMMTLLETGADSNPPRVPDSFSLTKSLVMI